MLSGFCRWLNLGGVLLAASVLGACASGQGVGNPLAALNLGSGFPPDRSGFAQLSPIDRAAHLQSIVVALDEPNNGAERIWTGETANGGVTLVETYVYGESLLCQVLNDRVEIGGQSFIAEDVACWDGTAWVWLRDTETPPAVLAPLADYPSYRIRSGGTLAAVARRTKVSRAVLEQMNPGMVGRRLNRNERVLLPPR